MNITITPINGFWVRKAYKAFYDHPYHGTLTAPNTFKDLKAWADSHKVGVDSLPVFSGGCDHTIYVNPEDNILFRAWHDLIHLELDASFSLEDEKRVFARHVEQLKAIGAPKCVIDAIHADGVAQVEYYYKYREYVVNQELFVIDCLNRSVEAVLASNTLY